MKKYLILGGSGFIGEKIVKDLGEKNQIIVADRLANNNFTHMTNVQFAPLDFSKTVSFKPLLKNVDMVIHLICTVFPKDGTENFVNDIESNILPTIRLLEDMKNTPSELLFLSSGGTIYGEGSNNSSKETDEKSAFCEYALLKIMIENTLDLYSNQYGLKYKTVRLSNPYGFLKSQKRMQGIIPIIINNILDKKPLTIWGDGHNIRDYIYIDDAIEAIREVINYNGTENIFNVGTGIGYSIMDVIDIICNAMNLSEMPEVIYEKPRKCDLHKNILDISRIMKATNWKPKVILEEGVKILLDEFRTLGNAS